MSLRRLVGLPAAASLLLFLAPAPPAAGMDLKIDRLSDARYSPVPVPETVMILDPESASYSIRAAEANGFTCIALASMDARGPAEADEMPFILELKAAAAGLGANAIELGAASRSGDGGISGVAAKAWRVEWKGKAGNFSGNFRDDALIMARLEDLGKVISPGASLEQKRVYLSSQVAGLTESVKTLFEMADLKMSTEVVSAPGFKVLTEEDRRKICKAAGSDDPACTEKADRSGKKGYLESLGLGRKNIKDLYESAMRLVKEYPAQFRQLKELYIKANKKEPSFDPAAQEKTEGNKEPPDDNGPAAPPEQPKK